MPRPPVSLSAPRPPNRVSLPVPPSTVSSPSPPYSVSLPVPRRRPACRCPRRRPACHRPSCRGSWRERPRRLPGLRFRPSACRRQRRRSACRRQGRPSACRHQGRPSACRRRRRRSGKYSNSSTEGPPWESMKASRAERLFHAGSCGKHPVLPRQGTAPGFHRRPAMGDSDSHPAAPDDRARQSPTRPCLRFRGIPYDAVPWSRGSAI